MIIYNFGGVEHTPEALCTNLAINIYISNGPVVIDVKRNTPGFICNIVRGVRLETKIIYRTAACENTVEDMAGCLNAERTKSVRIPGDLCNHPHSEENIGTCNGSAANPHPIILCG